MIVVADSSPINYLVLIGRIDILPTLFERIVIPFAVHRELSHARSPEPVQSWASELPWWCEALNVSGEPDSQLKSLDVGERAAIQLAMELEADYLLIDERVGREAALAKQLRVLGVLGVLRRAEQRGLLSLHDAFQRLARTNFRMSAQLRSEFLQGKPRE